MASPLPANVLAMLVFMAIAVAAAALLQSYFARRLRFRPMIVARPLPGRRGSPAGVDVRWVRHADSGLVVAQRSGTPSEPRRGARERNAGGGRFADPSDDDLAYLDAVDRASAFSFPASDPPALSCAASGLPTRPQRHAGSEGAGQSTS